MVGHGWHGENHDKLAREALDKGLLPTVESMMNHIKWKELDDDHALYYYCFAGSFTKFLISKYGKEKFEMLYKNTSRTKTKEENIAVFNDVYAIVPDEMERGWKIYLNK